MYKLKFVDFWPGFVIQNSVLWKVLDANFEVCLSEEPEHLIYSVFGGEHLWNQSYARCTKIMWTAESVHPNFNICDYALSFDYLDDPRHLRWPLYAQSAAHLAKPRGEDEVDRQRRKTSFCNFLYSNENCRERNKFFKLLSAYKPVDSGGAVMNNLGRRVTDKRFFLSHYKFTIAFENSSHPGYVTEKIVDPLFAGSVPIYWGSPKISEEFNPDCFINCHDYSALADVVRKVIEVDQDDNLYRQYLTAPRFPGGKLPACCKPNYLVPFFRRIFDDKTPRLHSKPNISDVASQGWSVLA